MKRYKVGVVGASSSLGKCILKSIIDNNFPYSFIRALSLNEDNKEVNVGDYCFTLNKLSINSLKELDIIYIVSKIDINREIIDYLNDSKKIFMFVNEDNLDCYDYVINEITNNFELKILDEVKFHCSSELYEDGNDTLKNQYIDYFNNRPLIASFIRGTNQNIPLAFNLVPFCNKDNIDFYIPSLNGSAILLKTESFDKEYLISKFKENNKIIYYENSLPTILDCEGNNFIHVGLLVKEKYYIFITFDYLKLIAMKAYNEIKARLEND